MTKQNRAMELYRFLASVLILCYHCYWFAFREEGTRFVGFYLFVELFFILAGFLMARSVRKNPTAASDPVGATVSYMKGRLKRLFPHHALSLVLVIFIRVFLMQDIFPVEVLKIGWAELFLVNIFGFVRGEYINIVCWYLSGLVFASLIIHYLLCRDGDRFVKILAPLIIVLVYGTLFDRKGSLAATIIFSQYSPFLGFFRSVAGVTVGCVAWWIYEWLEEAELPGEWLWSTVLEAGVLLAAWMWMYKNSGWGDFLFVPLFAVFIISVFRGKSLLTKLFDNPVSGWLGKHSYAYFLNNLVVILPCMYVFPEISLSTMCLVCAPACLLVSVITGTLLKKLTW